MKVLFSAETFSGPVEPEWLERGVFLSEAWRKFDGELLDKAKKYALDFARANGIEIQDDSEHKYETALNFAGSINNPNGLESKPDWRRFSTFQRLAVIEIRRRFCGAPGALNAFGRRGTAAGPIEWIPADTWLQLETSGDIKNFVSGGGECYFMVRVVDPIQWLDALVASASPPESGDDTIYRTGSPGRPTSIHLVKIELKRRAENGKIQHNSKRKEAALLAAWLKENHPDAPAMTAKTIENQIAAEWRGLALRSIPKINNAS